VRDECSKFGMILDIKVPRPVGGSRQSAGVGKIFVKYDSTESSTKALKALAGRKFADRTVVTTYFPEAGRLPDPLPDSADIGTGELRRRRMVDGGGDRRAPLPDQTADRGRRGVGAVIAVL